MDSQLTHFPYRLVLGSSSPRRQQLLRDLGLKFEIRTQETDETFSEELPVYEVPGMLAKRKATALVGTLSDNELLICSDTVVVVNQKILGKPVDLVEAKKMIQALSNATHEVVTGVCLQTKDHSHTFSVKTAVTFKELEDAEIDYYIKHYTVLDKAGAYGIQEWIGMIGVQNINGSYYNVMGLPVFELWEELQKIKNAQK